MSGPSDVPERRRDAAGERVVAEPEDGEVARRVELPRDVAGEVVIV